MKHIMDVTQKLRELIEDLEEIKNLVVAQSEIAYTSQDARMVALDSIQIAISSVGMWINSLNSLANQFSHDGVFDEQGFLSAVGSGVDIKKTEEIMFVISG